MADGMRPPDLPLAPDPVVMGGSPGSGTRVLASIAQGLGVYIGEEFNHALDNYWWTPLFKRPRWFLSLDGPDDPDFGRHMRIFCHAMAGSLRPTPGNAVRVVRAGLQSHVPIRHPLSAFRSDGYDPQRSVAWGWKEPTTHLMLEHHRTWLPEMRYVHLMWHGLDMAYPERPRYYEDWHPLFDFATPLAELAEPAARLKFWIAANRSALAFLEEAMPDDHLVLRFEDLIADPEPTIRELAGFVGADAPDETVAELADPIRVPESVGRYKDHDPGVFDEEDLEAVEALGYEVAWP